MLSAGAGIAVKKPAGHSHFDTPLTDTMQNAKQTAYQHIREADYHVIRPHGRGLVGRHLGSVCEERLQPCLQGNANEQTGAS